MQLIPISKDDLALFESINCDPVMMTGLGGPTPKERVPQILQNAVEFGEDGTCWYYKDLNKKIRLLLAQAFRYLYHLIFCQIASIAKTMVKIDLINHAVVLPEQNTV